MPGRQNDTDTKGKDDDPEKDDDLDPDDARRLLDDPDDDDEDDDPEGADQLGDAGKRALDRQKERAREAREARRAAEKERDELRAWRKQQEDKDKSEVEKATGDRDAWKTRAETAEGRLARRELAEELAPDHATARQIAQVAKRLQGEDEDAMRKDAEELFGLIAPAPAEDKSKGNGSSGNGKPPGRPKEKLRGGGDPDGDDPGEMDPHKLAALIPRRP